MGREKDEKWFTKAKNIYFFAIKLILDKARESYQLKYVEKNKKKGANAPYTFSHLIRHHIWSILIKCVYWRSGQIYN